MIRTPYRNPAGLLSPVSRRPLKAVSADPMVRKGWGWCDHGKHYVPDAPKGRAKGWACKQCKEGA